MQNSYFWGSVLVLAALLFLPTRKLVWVLSVRRLQRKLNMELSPEETAGQLQRANLLAAVLVLAFSLLFNISLLGLPQSG
jgi:hypothetical protein